MTFSLRFALLLAFSLTLAVWSALWTLADFYSLPWQWAKEKSTKKAIPQFRLKETRDLMAKAHELNPNQVDYLLELAQGTYQLANEEVRHSEGEKALLQEALRYYERAASLRPSWATTWINLAGVRLRLDPEQLPEALKDLERAITLDPWSPTIQMRAVSLGFVVWPYASSTLRERLISNAVKALNVDAKRVIQLAMEKGLIGELEPLLTPEARTILEKMRGQP
ncbi:MAG: hypothetical protein HQL56_05235 [Magnetococcales bacterium]|nr:hypothetical protein [Magnetococcales bacterium]